MNKLFKLLSKNKYLLLILFIAGTLRFVNLGYADFQGDEIKALFLPEQGQNITQFLLEQRKGPLQFFITYLLKFVDPNYTNQLLMRLPFAIAGFISVYFFYLLIRELFNEKVAFYSSFFFATNGFLVAFSRIVQYQSFVIMFMIGALYFLKKKKIYLGLIFWALSILAHYDGVLIFPLAFYFIYDYLFENKKISFKNLFPSRLKHFLGAGVLATTMLLAFYIPFGLNIAEDTDTQEYWLGRVTGAVSSKLSSSTYLFTVYQPIYVIHIYTALFSLGVLFALGTLITRNKRLAKIGGKLKKFKDKVLSIFNIDTETFGNGNIIAIALWLGISLLFMEGLVYIPGTHIYTYLIPMLVFLAFGILFMEEFTQRVLKLQLFKIVLALGTYVIFIFIAAQSYSIYVDNKYEYPWEEEKFLFWTFSKPTPAYHLSMFGFPYFRDWEGIQRFILDSNPQPAYSTNERTSISRHYVELLKDSNVAGFYVYIINPQTFTNEIHNEKVEYWVTKNKPVYIYERNGVELVNIYLMETGGLSEIILKGF